MIKHTEAILAGIAQMVLICLAALICRKKRQNDRVGLDLRGDHKPGNGLLPPRFVQGGFVRNKSITPRRPRGTQGGVDWFSVCFIIVWGAGMLVFYYLISQPLPK